MKICHWDGVQEPAPGHLEGWIPGELCGAAPRECSRCGHRELLLGRTGAVSGQGRAGTDGDLVFRKTEKWVFPVLFKTQRTPGFALRLPALPCPATPLALCVPQASNQYPSFPAGELQLKHPLTLLSPDRCIGPGSRCPKGQWGTAGTREALWLLLGAVPGAPGLWLPKTRDEGAWVLHGSLYGLSQHHFSVFQKGGAADLSPTACRALTSHPTVISSLGHPVHCQPHTAPSPSRSRKQGAQACGSLPSHCTRRPAPALVGFGSPSGGGCCHFPRPPLPAALGGKDGCLHWLRTLAQILCI